MIQSLLHQTAMAEQPRRRSRRVEVQKQDWSTVLPLELWECIGKKLPSGRDTASFRSMCSLWRAAFPFTKFAPVLMLPFDRESPHGAVTFYRPTDGKAFTKKLPALHRKVVCGSSHGWLALVDESACLTLLNPFTGATVALPRTDDGRFASFFWRDLVDGRWVHLSWYDGVVREIKLGEMRDMFITEVMLTSPADSGDCIAIVLLKGSGEVAYCRVGVDASWKLLHTKLRHQVSSVVQCRKRLLAISPSGGQVSICNLVGATPTARLVQVHCWAMPRDLSRRAYLQVNGELHLVGTVQGLTYSRQIYKCNVFSRTPVWSRVENAGDLTLVTSPNFMTGHGGGSVSGLMNNSGYFPVYQQLPTSEHLWLEISNIANGTIEMLPYHQNTDGTSEALCWIIPKPWTQGTHTDA